MTSPGTLTLAELQKLVADSKGEWEHLEFKKTTSELHGGMETLCAFLNGVGGKVLFGVIHGGRILGFGITAPARWTRERRQTDRQCWIWGVALPACPGGGKARRGACDD
jgi:predicted HTH transcriptional regulator